MTDILKKYDTWLDNTSDIAALTMRQLLEPVEGQDAVVFPPTYPIEKDKAGYNIDILDGDSNVCQIDSVGSQANRMEPIFMMEPYSKLVPQVVIKAKVDGKERQVHLLEAGHRAADAIMRFSTLGPELHEAFIEIRDRGNAEPLARIAPTSIVFGVWDSRGTQVKLPRVVRSVIRAFDVKKLHRSAQYSTIAGEILEGPEVEVTTKGVKAELGFAHVPAVRTHGGVLVQGDLRREGALNLVAIRSLGTALNDVEGMLSLRRYILGLALVSLTAPQNYSLREGCQLVPIEGHPAVWKIVKHDGKREVTILTLDHAIEYATAAAKAFGVGDAVSGEFNSKLANQVQALSEKDRKILLRQGPVTPDAIEQLRKSKGKKKNDKGDVSNEVKGDA